MAKVPGKRRTARPRVVGETELAALVGANLRKLRTRRGLSLERLADRSGVSRSMISQIELGNSSPTVNVASKIARALGLSFAALIARSHAYLGVSVMRRSQAELHPSADGASSARPLFPADVPRRAEFFELRLAAGREQRAEAYAIGATGNLTVAAGIAEVELAGAAHHLRQGDTIQFEADTPHVYRNRGDREALMYLVLTTAPDTYQLEPGPPPDDRDDALDDP